MALLINSSSILICVRMTGTSMCKKLTFMCTASTSNSYTRGSRDVPGSHGASMLSTAREDQIEEERVRPEPADFDL
jgi:hypothetical protein